MKWFWLVVAICIVGAGLWYFTGKQQVTTVPNTATATATSTVGASDIIPGTPNQEYVNSRYSFSIEYPASASSSQVQFDGYLPLTQTPVISFVLPRSMFAGTNLTEAGVYIGATTTPNAIQKCTEPQKDLNEAAATSTVTIGDQTFAVFTSRGAGAGNYYDEKVFRTIQNGACLEIVELLHSGNIGNYTPGTVHEFDRAKSSGILERIVQSYRPIPTGQ